MRRPLSIRFVVGFVEEEGLQEGERGKGRGSGNQTRQGDPHIGTNGEEGTELVVGEADEWGVEANSV